MTFVFPEWVLVVSSGLFWYSSFEHHLKDEFNSNKNDTTTSLLERMIIMLLGWENMRLGITVISD